MSTRFLIVIGGTGKGLLGQTAALGVAQEWQLDVTTEKHRLRNPTRTHFVALDQHVGAVPVLAAHYLNLLGLPNNIDANRPAPYLDNGLSTAAARRHANFYWNNVPAALLMYGLAQAPATGSATARYPATYNTLWQAFTPMVHEAGMDGAEVWIVSSTAGGTGQGIHRFVGALIAQLFTTVDTNVALNFVQVGQTTFAAVGEQTKTNTFLGVAADVAFHHLAQTINHRVVPNFFYLDLPNVGAGGNADLVRQQIVQMSVKTLMLQEMHEDLTQLLINRHGLRFVIARTGFWGRDYDLNSRYRQSLKAMQSQLNKLLLEEPEFLAKATLVIAGPDPAPIFNSTTVACQEALDQLRDAQKIQHALTAGTRPPAFRLPAVPPPLYRDWNPGTKTIYDTLLDQWKTFFEQAFNITATHLGANFTYNRLTHAPGEATVGAPVPLTTATAPAQALLNDAWLSAVNDMQKVRIWCHCLLNGHPTTEFAIGARTEFLMQAQKAYEIDKRWWWGNNRKAQELKSILPELLTLLIKVTYLETELQAAETRLETALATARDIKDYAAQQLRARGTAHATAHHTPDVIFTAGLAEVTDQTTNETWLKKLEIAVLHNNDAEFQRAVLAGAVGLTQPGLAQVLDLPPAADINQIINRLQAEPADTLGDAIDLEHGVRRKPIWWQHSQASGIPNDAQYHYRILPKLEPGIFQDITQGIGNDTATGLPIKTIEERFGRTGLYALTFHGISLNQVCGDVRSAPAYLLGSFRQYISNLMTTWFQDEVLIAGNPSANYKLAAASAIGEPLDLPALMAAKLTVDQVKILAKYYPMHSKPRAADLNMPTIMGEVQEVEAEFNRLAPPQTPNAA